MASTREIRRASVLFKAPQETKAMELVAASKMRRHSLTRSPPDRTREKMREVIGNLAALRQPDQPCTRF